MIGCNMMKVSDHRYLLLLCFNIVIFFIITLLKYCNTGSMKIVCCIVRWSIMTHIGVPVLICCSDCNHTDETRFLLPNCLQSSFETEAWIWPTLLYDILKPRACNLLIMYFCLVATCIISSKQTETDVSVEV